MGFLKVDQTGAQAIVSSLQSNASAREADLAALSSKANPSGVWEGLSASAYENAYLQWQAAEKNLVQALQNMAAQAQKIVNNFELIDQQGAGAFPS
jgi:uncharacterized protein YukE